MRRTLYRQDRLNGSSKGSEDGSSTCGDSITASEVSKESGFDNKSEISEGERVSSPEIPLKQKIRVHKASYMISQSANYHIRSCAVLEANFEISEIF